MAAETRIMRRWLPLLAFTVLIVALLAYSPSGASDANRVAVVVDFGNGQVASRCVSFSEETITGFDALERTGLPVETDFQTGGAAVCRIDQQGCPSDDCFCSCRGGGDCLYWSYWHLADGVWHYSSAGSALYRVGDGAIEGWAWGLGSVTQASPPPIVSFSDVCATEPTPTPTQTATPSRTATPVILPTAVLVDDTPPATATSSSASPPATAAAGLVTATTTISASATSSVLVISPTPIISSQEQSTGISTPVFATQPAEPISSGGEGQVQSGDAAIVLAATQPVAEVGGAVGTSTPVVAPVAGATEVAVAVAIEAPDSSITPTTGMDETAHMNVNGQPPALMPATPAAIVGASDTLAPPQSPDNGQGVEDADWASYAGFLGLVFFVAALALLVFRRRDYLQRMEP